MFGGVVTLQGINISHLGKRKIIFKIPFLGDMLVPWRVTLKDVLVNRGITVSGELLLELSPFSA